MITIQLDVIYNYIIPYVYIKKFLYKQIKSKIKFNFQVLFKKFKSNKYIYITDR